jgi:hypothetical protein
MADESTRRAVEEAAAAADNAAAAARDAAEAARKTLAEPGQPDSGGNGGDGSPETTAVPDQGGGDSEPYVPTRGTDSETEYGTGEGDL